jgi:hypothetical protein
MDWKTYSDRCTSAVTKNPPIYIGLLVLLSFTAGVAIRGSLKGDSISRVMLLIFLVPTLFWSYWIARAIRQFRPGGAPPRR